MNKAIPNTKHDPYTALRVREFVLFISTRFFLTIAIQMQGVIVGWQIYKYTKDELALGMIGLAEAIPFIVVSLFSGHVADNVSRKRIILVSSFFLILSTFSLLYISIDSYDVIKNYGTSPIYFIIGCIGVIRGFFSASFSSFMSQIVPRELYANSATWNSTVWHIASIIGPAAAGFICAISFEVAYEVNIVFISLSIFSLLFIASKPLPRREKKESLRQSLSVGINFVFKNQLILGALSLDLFAVLFGGAVAMLPAYADKVLHVGSVELGFLRAAPALGAVIMAIIIAYKPPTHNAGRNLFISIGAFGFATILFGISTNY